MREALFSTLDTMTPVHGSRFADLYAGSGAVGLEAYSRGAAHALLVESDPRAARAARENVAALGAAPAVRVVTLPVERLLATPPDEPYGVVFADPQARMFPVAVTFLVPGRMAKAVSILASAAGSRLLVASSRMTTSARER